MAQPRAASAVRDWGWPSCAGLWRRTEGASGWKAQLARAVPSSLHCPRPRRRIRPRPERVSAAEAIGLSAKCPAAAVATLAAAARYDDDDTISRDAALNP